MSRNWKDYDRDANSVEEDFVARNGELTLTEEVVNSQAAAIDQRYKMQPAVVAALKHAGKIAAMRLAALMENDEAFGELDVETQVKIISIVLDKAYGRAEAASAYAMAATKVDAAQGTSRSSLSEQLRKIDMEGFIPPEQRKSRSAKNLAGDAQSPREPAGGGNTSGVDEAVREILPGSQADSRRRLVSNMTANVVKLHPKDIPSYRSAF